MADITIDGNGFYQLTAHSACGRRFLRQVQGTRKGTTYCDDTRMTQNIADGAVAEGLNVEVNGVAYRP